jgi:hypothetical protein
MSLFYTAPIRNVTLGANAAAPQNIFELINGAVVSLRIHHVHLESFYNVDERIDLQFMWLTGTGSNGNAITPTPRSGNNTIASKVTSFKSMVTGPGTPSTGLESFQWSQLGPLDLLFTPEERPEVPGSGSGNPYRFALNNANSYVAANRVISGYVTWEEIG